MDADGGTGCDLLEPSLAVLALVSDPSSVAHARPVDTFPGEAALVARLAGGGVRRQHQVEQHARQQVSVDGPHGAVAAWSRSKND